LNVNPVVPSIPIFFVLIGIELLVERFTQNKLYRSPDAISNIGCGITAQLSGLFLNLFAIGLYQVLFEKFTFFTADNSTWWYWVLLILLVDFAYYRAHRMSHEINLFRKGHLSLSPGFILSNDNMSTCKWVSIFLFFFCLSCDKPMPTLEGIDLARWKEDQNACSHLRTTMREAMDREKNKLLSLGELQIVELLGKPDQNELSKRNQKFFYYFLEPGPACHDRADSVAARLSIRFNAMGLAKEVAIE
jgi:hypothetical protein